MERTRFLWRWTVAYRRPNNWQHPAAAAIHRVESLEGESSNRRDKSIEQLQISGVETGGSQLVRGFNPIRLHGPSAEPHTIHTPTPLSRFADNHPTSRRVTDPRSHIYHQFRSLSLSFQSSSHEFAALVCCKQPLRFVYFENSRFFAKRIQYERYITFRNKGKTAFISEY